MGRKRRCKTTPSSKQQNDESTLLLDDDVAELLVALFDLFGFYTASNDNSNGNNSRLQLLSLLQCLSRDLQTTRSILDDSSSCPLTDESSTKLLQLEETIASIRNHADSFLDDIQEERSESLLLMQELEATSSTLSWFLFAQSLVSEYRTQSQMEENRIRSLRQDLQTIYDSNDKRKDDFKHHLQQAINCLSRKALLSRPHLQEGVTLIEQLLQGHDHAFKERQNVERTPFSLSQPQNEGKLTSMGSRTIEAVSKEKSAWCAFEAFLASNEEAGLTAIFVVGAEGSGKTHLCNKMEERAKSSSECMIIRPRLPLDFLQDSVGETEDVLVSICGSLRRSRGRALLLLDDVEYVMACDNQVEASHQMRRSQSTFLSMMDSIRRNVRSETSILIVCTSSQDIGAQFLRFDATFHLEPPNEIERRVLMESLFGLDELIGRESHSKDQEFERLLSALVEHTVGRSYAELVQLCRQSIEQLAASRTMQTTGLSRESSFAALLALQERLQTITPESLRGGVIDEYVDMRVFTAQDLLSSLTENQKGSKEYQLPLKGSSAANAWKQLESSIVFPLCKSRQLMGLLDKTSNGDQRSVIGAVLLTGAPGCGKSEIALHCAKYAAHLLPSITLVEVSCTSLIHKEVGGSEKAIRHLFDSARRAAPCILLMDGIENVAAVRGNDTTTEGTLDRVLSTLLVELDGVEESTDGPSGGVAVIGIAYDARLIDPAVKRQGRLNPVLWLSADWNN